MAKQYTKVRELEKLFERSLIMNRGEPLRLENLVSLPSKHVDANTGVTEDETLEFDARAKRHVHGVLEQTNGKIHGPRGVGELLGMNPNTFR